MPAEWIYCGERIRAQCLERSVAWKHLVDLRVVDHLEAFEHLINQVLDLLLGQALDLHELAQVSPHEGHHQVAAEVAMKKERKVTVKSLEVTVSLALPLKGVQGHLQVVKGIQREVSGEHIQQTDNLQGAPETHMLHPHGGKSRK